MWFVKTIQDVLLSTIKPLFEEQRKQSEKRDAEVDQRFDQLEKRSEKRDIEVNQQFTALKEEIGVKTEASKKDMILSIAPMFEDIHERITKEIRRVILLDDQTRLQMKDAMVPTQMVTEHESTIKNYGARIENMETEVHLLKTMIKKPEKTV